MPHLFCTVWLDTNLILFLEFSLLLDKYLHSNLNICLHIYSCMYNYYNTCLYNLHLHVSTCLHVYILITIIHSKANISSIWPNFDCKADYRTLTHLILWNTKICDKSANLENSDINLKIIHLFYFESILNELENLFLIVCNYWCVQNWHYDLI